MNTRWSLPSCVLLAAAMIAGAPSEGRAADGPPNVIYILADDK